MTSRLSSDTSNQLTPLLGSLARLVARGAQVSEAQLHTLLVGAGLEEEPAVLEELKRWGRLLIALREQPSEENRQATVEAFMLRGLPEAPVLLAVDAVAGRGGVSLPDVGEGQGGVSPRLMASVARLDLGVLPPGQGATAEFEVQGGPGQIEVKSDQVQVTPQQFGAGPTRIRVEVKPLSGGMLLWTTLKLITPGETLEVPVLAQWQEPAPPATLGPESAVPPLPGREEPPFPLPAPVMVVPEVRPAAPVPALRGYFLLPDLAGQGMERRLGRGLPQQVIPLGDEQVLVIAGGGAGLFDLRRGECLWEVDCPATCGALSPDGTMLVLGGARHLYLWDLRRGQFLRTLEGHTAWVRSVAFSPDGALWFGTRDGGASRLTPDGRWQTFTTEDGLAGNDVRAIAVAPDGALWFGTDEGASRLMPDGRWRTFTTRDGLVANVVRAIAVGPDGSLWFGTDGGGVSRYQPSR